MAKNQPSRSGDGFRFERDVELLLTALMLADSGVDLWPNEQIVAICPQCNGSEDIEIDDFLITLKGSSNQSVRKVYLQCKSTVKLYPSDSGFSKTVAGAYHDYLNGPKGSCKEYVMVTGPMSREDFVVIDQALVNIHQRRYSQFVAEKDIAEQKLVASFFVKCIEAVKYVDKTTPDECALYSALQHFHVLRPDLRTRGSLDGSLSDALFRKLGYERVQDLDNALRSFFEDKNRAGAEFRKEDVESVIQEYRTKTVKTSSDDIGQNHDRGVVVDFAYEDPGTWSSRIASVLFSNDTENSVLSFSLRADAARELAERIHALPKLPFAAQLRWQPVVDSLKQKFIEGGPLAWAKAGSSLGVLMEAAPEPFIERLGSMSREKGSFLSLRDIAWGRLPYDILSGFSELLSSGYQVAPLLGLAIEMAKDERIAETYGDAHRFLEYLLSDEYTYAAFTVEERIAVVDSILGVDREMGWAVLLNLLPTIRTVRLSYACPSMLSNYTIAEGGLMVPDSRPMLAEGDIKRLREAFVNKVLAVAEKDPLRLSKLISMLSLSSMELLEAVVETIGKDWSFLGDEGRAEITKALSDAWPSCAESTFYREECESRTKKIYELLRRIYGEDIRTTCEILLNADSYLCPDNVKGYKRDSLKALHANGGIDEVLECVKNVRFSYGVGEALYDAIGATEAEDVLKTWLDAKGERERDFAKSYLCHCFRHEKALDGRIKDDWQWAEGICAKIPDEKGMGLFFAALPFSSSVWMHVEKMLSREEQEWYFRRLQIAIPYDKIYDGVGFVIKGLVSVSRALDAIKLCTYIGKTAAYDVVFLAEAFEALPDEDYPLETWRGVLHNLCTAITYLQNSDVVALRRISDIEIKLYDRIFVSIYATAKPEATYRLLSSSPPDFVRMLRSPDVSTRKIIDSCRFIPGFGQNGLDESECVKWIRGVFALVEKSSDLWTAVVEYIARFIFRMIDNDGTLFRCPKLCKFLESNDGLAARLQIKANKDSWHEFDLRSLTSPVVQCESNEARNARIRHTFEKMGYAGLAAIF